MPQRIIVVGAGFAGMWSALAARRFISMNLKTKEPDIEVIVVAPEPRLVIRPRLYEANPASMSAPLEDLFQVTGVQFIQGTVKSISTDEHAIEVADPTGTKSTYGYDRLILAAGSRLQRPNIPGLQDHSYDVDQIEGATKLENHLKRLASITPSQARDTVVVCGSGFTGIELATELPQRLRGFLGDHSNIRVVVVERGNEIGKDIGPNPRPVIMEALQQLGVEVKLGAAVTKIDAEGVTLSTGEYIRTLTAVWTAGMIANELNKQVPGEKDKAGRLHVDKDLRALLVHDVFVTGDAAVAATDDQGNHTLMSCQHAMPLGTAAGHNAAADLLGIATTPYSQPVYGTCLDLGAFGAVVSEGWDRKVVSKGPEGKRTKQVINTALIYPPKANVAEAFEGADPTVSAAPAARRLYLSIIKSAGN
ncbi:FAD/NAD(P)-binding domain-containing protein [Phaeosphaeriaceae sp. SRC1lsM3a]|nr:FAD/NAD(P)-binding domain-containing protein [Stagonospora sp. SRC1lsM3a]